jgi:hypothetical protein
VEKCPKDGSTLTGWEDRPFCSIFLPCPQCHVVWIYSGINKPLEDARDVLDPAIPWNKPILAGGKV